MGEELVRVDCGVLLSLSDLSAFAPISGPRFLLRPVRAGQWWHTPSILAFRRQRWVDLWEFKVSLVYTVSSGQAPKLQRNPVLKNNKQTRNTPKTIRTCKLPRKKITKKRNNLT